MAYEAQERKDGGGQERTATLQLVIALSRAFQGDRTRRPATSRGARPWPDRIRGARGAVSQGRTAPGGDSRSDSCDGASTTYLVKKLEDRGLMRRRTCDEDQRIVFGEL